MRGDTCRRAAFGMPLVLLLASCASGPDVSTGSEANPNAARGLLAVAAQDGQPVPLAIDSLPVSAYPAGPAAVAATATASVAWLGARFAAQNLGEADPNARRVVFRFEDVPRSPAAVCSASPPRGPLPPGPPRLFAVFCDGARPVADVDGTATSEAPSAGDELVTSVTQRMFPGQGSNYYAVPGVSLGVGIGTGSHRGWGWGSGIGIGLGF